MNKKNRGETTVINPVALSAAMSGDLKNAIVASTLGGIEAQEAQGQKELANSSELPVRAPWEELRKMGITDIEDYNEAAKQGKLFCKAELPPGWKKMPTDHSMWTDLVDDKGVKKASIFYKAAFYDMDAFLVLE